MSTAKQETRGGLPIVNIIIGLALMFGGYYVSKNIHLGVIDRLAAQGIPLDPGKTVATIGVFLILFPVINFFFITPLRDAIQERTGNLERTFTEAESLRAEMTKMRSDYEARIQQTEASAREQIQSQIREAQNLRGQLMAEATQRAEELVARAQVEIEAEKQKAITELRLHVVDLTLTAAERVIGQNMNTDINRRLVDEFIDKVEVNA
jgi:F-type H+-transporting ATPase subunit b